MLARVKRNVWRFLGPALLLSALWFNQKSREVNQQWEQHLEDTENKRKEFATKVRERRDAGRKVPGGDQDLASDVINLQTEQFILQQESLNRAQELYYERYENDLYYFLLTVIGLLIIEFQLWRSAGSWKRKCLALRDARRREIEAREEAPRSDE